MPQPQTPTGFDEEKAAAYDDRFAKISAVRDALHLQLRAVLLDLPANARVLCVGAGTGAEMVTLATHFPRWQFTAVEPSTPMMKICQRRMEQLGFADRCTFHTGYLDSLPPSESFDAVCCLLVSHFIVDRDARREFFKQMASRLRPQGLLVNADLSGDQNTPEHTKLEAVWFRLMSFTDQTKEQNAQMHAAYRRDVSFLAPAELEALIASAGFDYPTLFYQALLIRAWFSRRSA